MAKDGGGERSEWRLKCKTEGSEWLSEGAEGGSVVEACDNGTQIRGDLCSRKQESPHNTTSISSLPLGKQNNHFRPDKLLTPNQNNVCDKKRLPFGKP
uniref:Uncharacterized protein n=1 Tax=Sparus aurata TaxID=8175 RepID=A0A671UYC3_SPAAU